MSKEIGIVQLWYNEQGVAIKGNFQPAIKNYTKDCLDQLMRGISATDDTTKIKNDSELLVSDWFNTVDEIELADRDKFKIVSTVQRCDKWGNGNVQYCVLRFTLEEIN